MFSLSLSLVYPGELVFGGLGTRFPVVGTHNFSQAKSKNISSSYQFRLCDFPFSIDSCIPDIKHDSDAKCSQGLCHVQQIRWTVYYSGHTVCVVKGPTRAKGFQTLGLRSCSCICYFIFAAMLAH